MGSLKNEEQRFFLLSMVQGGQQRGIVGCTQMYSDLRVTNSIWPPGDTVNLKENLSDSPPHNHTTFCYTTTYPKRQCQPHWFCCCKSSVSSVPQRSFLHLNHVVYASCVFSAGFIIFGLDIAWNLLLPSSPLSLSRQALFIYHLVFFLSSHKGSKGTSCSLSQPLGWGNKSFTKRCVIAIFSLPAT